MQIVILIVEPALEVAPQQVCFLPRARFNRIFAVYTDLSYQRMRTGSLRHSSVSPRPRAIDLSSNRPFSRSFHAGYSRPMPRVRSTIASPIGRCVICAPISRPIFPSDRKQTETG